MNENHTKWVIIEIVENNGMPEAFIAPSKLKLEYGFVGTIHWYIFTPGWELFPTDGIVFGTPSPFASEVAPDETRVNVWSAAVANELTAATGSYNYSIHYRRVADAADFFREDPVVENEPPPTIDTPPPVDVTAKKSRQSSPASVHPSN